MKKYITSSHESLAGYTLCIEDGKLVGLQVKGKELNAPKTIIEIIEKVEALFTFIECSPFDVLKVTDQEGNVRELKVTDWEGKVREAEYVDLRTIIERQPLEKGIRPILRFEDFDGCTQKTTYSYHIHSRTHTYGELFKEFGEWTDGVAFRIWFPKEEEIDNKTEFTVRDTGLTIHEMTDAIYGKSERDGYGYYFLMFTYWR